MVYKVYKLYKVGKNRCIWAVNAEKVYTQLYIVNIGVYKLDLEGIRTLYSTLYNFIRSLYN